MGDPEADYLIFKYAGALRDFGGLEWARNVYSWLQCWPAINRRGRNCHVVDQFWCLRRGAGVEWGLRIVFDSKLNALGYFGSGDLRGEGEGKVYACGDAGAGHDPRGVDDALFGWLGAVGGKGVVGAAVGGGGQSVQQPGGAGR